MRLLLIILVLSIVGCSSSKTKRRDFFSVDKRLSPLFKELKNENSPPHVDYKKVNFDIKLQTYNAGFVSVCRLSEKRKTLEINDKILRSRNLQLKDVLRAGISNCYRANHKENEICSKVYYSGNGNFNESNC